MDAPSPDFNVDGRQWRSSVVFIFARYFRAIWLDPQACSLTIDRITILISNIRHLGGGPDIRFGLVKDPPSCAFRADQLVLERGHDEGPHN